MLYLTNSLLCIVNLIEKYSGLHYLSSVFEITIEQNQVHINIYISTFIYLSIYADRK